MEREELELKLNSLIEVYGYKLYRAYHIKEDGMKFFRVEIDGEVNLEICEKISRDIDGFLEQEKIFDFAYILDVCGVGVEKEIKIEDLTSNIGKYIYVEFLNKNIEGYLSSVDDQTIFVDYLNKNIKKTIEIKKSDINFIRNAIKF